MQNAVSKFFAALALGAMLMPALAMAEASTAATATLAPAGGTHQKRSVIIGTVSSVSGSTISITGNNSTTDTVDASAAKLVRRYGATMQISDIQNGDTLQVYGTVSGSSVAATEIRDISLQAKNGTFSGTVQSVGSDSFVLTSKSRGNQNINIDSTTVFKKNGQSASSSDVLAGETVTVSGVWDRTNTNVTATRVSIIVRNVNTAGTVSSVSETNITLTGKNGTTYSVDASSAKLVRHFGASMQISDIQNGDTLTVTGPVLNGSITAKTVRDDSLQTRYGTFNGTVQSINSDSFVLTSQSRGNQTINMATSTVVKQGGQTVSYSNIAAGQTVTVSGVWDRTNSNVTANHVTIKVTTKNISGTIQSISGNILTIATASSTSYSVDVTNAKVYYKGWHSGSLEILQTNDQVAVRGTVVSGSTNVTASSVRDLSQTYSKPGNVSSSTPSSNN